MSKKNVRKTAAIGLAFIGLAGVGVASAAQLTLNGGDQNLVQANTADFHGSACQTSTITATFTLSGATPGSLATESSFGYPSTTDAVRLASIDSACAGKTIKVALGGSGNTLLGTEYSAPAATGPLVLSLGASGDFGPTAISPNSITKISVTIFD